MQIDKVAKVPESAQKVQLTISPRDGDNTLTSRAGTARSPNVNLKTPNVNLKTPIVVKRIEPGKPPTLSSLTTKTPQQVGFSIVLCSIVTTEPN